MRPITFEFISSGDSASYRVVAYDRPAINGARVEVHHHARPLVDPYTGRRRYNYTPEKYKIWREDTCGYMCWHRAGPVPWEVVRAFRKFQTDQYEHARDVWAPRHNIDPDDIELPSLIKGRYYCHPDDFSVCVIEDYEHGEN